MFRSTHSLFVSQFTRRAMLKGAAAAVAMPALVSNALSSSGSLSIINWDDELPNPLIPNFEKATGIKVNSTPFSQNEEQINKLQATGGEGFDVCQPTHDRAVQFKDIDVLQPIDIKPNSTQPASSCRACSGGLDQELDLGRQTLPCAACLGHRGDRVAQRSRRRSSRRSFPSGRYVERRVQRQSAGASALFAARHRPLSRRRRQAAEQPDAGFAFKDEATFKKLYDEILALRRSPTSRGSSSSGIPPTTRNLASRPTAW